VQTVKLLPRHRTEGPSKLGLVLKYPAEPAYAHRHADLVVEASALITGATLDYSPGSLAAVDEILEGFRSDGLAVDQMAETLFTFGCYVGEVLVLNARGTWRASAKTPMASFTGSPMVVQLGPEEYANPIDKVFESFEDGPGDSLANFYQVVTSS
jgi:hypothetical protein